MKAFYTFTKFIFCTVFVLTSCLIFCSSFIRLIIKAQTAKKTDPNTTQETIIKFLAILSIFAILLFIISFFFSFHKLYQNNNIIKKKIIIKKKMNLHLIIHKISSKNRNTMIKYIYGPLVKWLTHSPLKATFTSSNLVRVTK